MRGWRWQWIPGREPRQRGCGGRYCEVPAGFRAAGYPGRQGAGQRVAPRWRCPVHAHVTGRPGAARPSGSRPGGPRRPSRSALADTTHPAALPPLRPLQGPSDLSAAFEGSTAAEAACLLRFLYRPQEATPAAFAALAAAGRLPGVAALAHKLDIPRPLAAIEAYLEGGRGPREGRVRVGVGVEAFRCYPGWLGTGLEVPCCRHGQQTNATHGKPR